MTDHIRLDSSLNSASVVSSQGVNKRNLRHRKIHSVKRQIQIKEKMLEVCLEQF